jgi:hypothetical protein
MPPRENQHFARMFTEVLWEHTHGAPPPLSDAANIDQPPPSSDATNVDPL